MNRELLISPATKSALLQMAASPSHAISLVAPSGFGKLALAHWLAAEILGLKLSGLDSYAYLSITVPDAKVGYVEQIRQLEEFFKLKTPGTRQIRRIAIIDHADILSASAQSALLKTLEEPPSDSVIILTINSESAVLPTVLSRLQSLRLCPPARLDMYDYFADFKQSNADFDKILMLGDGLPGRIKLLLSGEGDQDWREDMDLARQIISSSTFVRLGLIDTVAKDSGRALNIARLIITIAGVGLNQSAAKHDLSALKRWLSVLKTGTKAAEALQLNAQPKLVLTDMMLQL